MSSPATRETESVIRIGRFEIERNFLLFIIAIALLGANAAIENSSLSNRLHDELGFTVLQRGALEFPRELPGLLGAFFLAALASLGDIKSMALACFIAGGGMLAFGLIPPSYLLVVITIFIYSAGNHMTIPLNNSVSMSFAKGGHFGQRLGEMQSLNSLMVILFSGLLFVLYRFVHMPIWVSFLLGAAAFFAAGVLFLMIRLPANQITRSKFVLKKEYSLYYTLSLINGARKQLTITFVPWLIIEVFGQSVSTVSLLYFITATCNVFFRPYLGKLIDRRGEKFVLCGEALLLMFVSLGFAFSKTLLPEGIAFLVVCACYILDNLLISVSIARATYARKIAVVPEDVSPTLAMGMSFDHIIATTLPFLAGFIWAAGGGNGYIYVFCGGVVISLLNFLCASRIRIPQTAVIEQE